MEKQICVILTRDEGYADHLCTFLNSMPNFPFEVYVYTDETLLKRDAEKQNISALLLGEEFSEEMVLRSVPGRIVLTEKPVLQETDKSMVYKYQAADHLMEQILDILADKTRSFPGSFSSAAPAFDHAGISAVQQKWIGIYSPVGRCGKTGFAIGLGEVLAEKKQVLYINLEEFHGLAKMWPEFSGSTDLTDLLYFYRQGDTNLYLRMSGMLKSFRGLDYIPPTMNGWDIRDIDAEEWIGLFQQLDAAGEYDYLILDLGTQVRDIYKILNRCGRVYVPGCQDPFSLAKMEQFRANVLTLGYRKLSDRMQEIFCPEEKNELQPQEFVAQLLKGKNGMYARSIARRDGLMQ